MFDLNLPIAAIPENYREFLPTMTTPAVDELLREYEEGEAEMRRFHSMIMTQENSGVLKSFAYGAEAYYQSSNRSRSWSMDLIEMFDLQRAIYARQEHCWFRLFDMCSFTNILPSELWTKWSDSFTAWRKIGGMGIPAFDRSTVFGSLSLIESHRANFFSMRVDAVWKALSGWHKTNIGSGFHERFIIDGMFNDYGSASHKDRAFYDLINICSTVMTGAEDPFFNTYGVLRDSRSSHCGEWVEVLDGVLRIKAFKRGTLHCEIHPEVANRLNISMAYIHPTALPDDSITTRPRRKTGFGSAALVRAMIPRQVRSYLQGCVQKQNDEGLWVLMASSSMHFTERLSGAIKGMIDEVLAQIGGFRDGGGHLFDYPPMDVVSHIAKSGEIPEKVSHQFYSTSKELAQEFIEWVGVEESSTCYETSAGTGGIAKHMPLQTICVEVDRLRAMALDKMGFEVRHADFLQLVPADLSGEVDVVLMNPPFADRQWQDHIEHAVQFVRAGGTIGAILPVGSVLKMPTINGVEVEYSEPKNKRFPDASVSVVFAKWRKPTVDAHGNPTPKGSEPQIRFEAA